MTTSHCRRLPLAVSGSCLLCSIRASGVSVFSSNATARSISRQRGSTGSVMRSKLHCSVQAHDMRVHGLSVRRKGQLLEGQRRTPPSVGQPKQFRPPRTASARAAAANSNRMEICNGNKVCDDGKNYGSKRLIANRRRAAPRDPLTIDRRNDGDDDDCGKG